MPLILLMILIILSTPSAPVEAQRRNEAIDDCLLTYLKAAKLDRVSILIRTTCQATYEKPNFLRKSEVKYNYCLLENLQGVESGFAADTIIRTCNRKHLKRRSTYRR
jgi:hypothetical protein